MKLKIIIRILAIFIVIINISCKNDADKWAVKIDDDEISIDEFYKFYYAQNKIFLNLEKKEIDKLSAEPSAINHPTLNKTRFLDFLISRKLLYQKAKNDESIDKDELKIIIELSKMQAAANFYMLEKFREEIKITDEEAEQFYNANKRLFKGVPIDQNMVNRIKQQIFMQKLEQKSNEFILNLIAESKVNREGFKKHLSKDKKNNKDSADDEKKENSELKE